MLQKVFIGDKDIDETISSILSNQQEILLTTKEAAKYLRCSTVTFWKIRKSGAIKNVFVSKKMFFPKEYLDKYLTQIKPEVAND